MLFTPHENWFELIVNIRMGIRVLRDRSLGS
jgi:hypothetical protein